MRKPPGACITAAAVLLGFFLLTELAGREEKEAVPDTPAAEKPAADANTSDWRKPFVPDDHTVLLLHADMGTEGQDVSKTESHVSKYVGNVELVRGKFKQAYNFTDWRSRIEIAHQEGLSFAGASAVTIEYWMKLYKMPAMMSSSIVVAKNDMLHSSIWLNQRSRMIGAQVHGVSDKEQKPPIFAALTFPPPDFDFSEWHHYAFVFTVLEGKVPGWRLLFIDGKLMEAQPHWIKEFNSSDVTMYIGNSADSGSHRGTRPFEGALDEIRISRVARYSATEEEIKKLREGK